MGIYYLFFVDVWSEELGAHITSISEPLLELGQLASGSIQAVFNWMDNITVRFGYIKDMKLIGQTVSLK